MKQTWFVVSAALLLAGGLTVSAAAQTSARPRTGVKASPAAARLTALKADVSRTIEARHAETQQMVDMVFSFGELGLQEVETSKYLTGVLEKNGFTVQRGVAGLPTGWWATWGSGKPVIALGSDIDGIPQASQKPGVAYRDPIVAGAPGHGEGHNSGVPLNITAALAVKQIMEREKIPGTLVVWPGVAEELGAGKGFFVRAGLFKDVDAVLFCHVGDQLGVSWGARPGTGTISVEYGFKGESAHAAGAPWRGRSALDAVELMDIGWNFRREHLRLSQRSHYVITNGGDQPNVVPQNAAVWYYLREVDAPHMKELRQIADKIANGAAEMTDTTVTGRVLGASWPQHFSKPIAESMFDNINAVGMPAWDDRDQALARGIQTEVGGQAIGLRSEVAPLQGHVPPEQNPGGGSDDIGDISWIVPTVTLRYPANIPNLPGHSWANAVAMATPIAHKGATAGAKVQAMTVLDLLLTPELLTQAKAYFAEQTKEITYESFFGPNDNPVLTINEAVLEKYRPEMRKFYFDPTKYKTYLEQLGVTYPTVKK